jgi:ribosomal protein L7/L12
MILASTCAYCGYAFSDDERVCPRCGGNREEASPLPPASELDEELSQDAMWREVIQLLKKKRKVQAIAVYRQAKNTGLKEAKDAIDKVERDLGL